MSPFEAATYTDLSQPHTRRSFLRKLTAVGTASRFLFDGPGAAQVIPGFGVHRSLDGVHAAKAANDGDESIRPFRIDFREAALVDLRRRVGATNWPERELVTDQGETHDDFVREG